MTCKHRWEQVTYIKSLTPNHYMYQCTRCGNIISAILKEKT
jgi:hypothetical protein